MMETKPRDWVSTFLTIVMCTSLTISFISLSPVFGVIALLSGLKAMSREGYAEDRIKKMTKHS